MEITKQPSKTLYERIGGETMISALVDRFYELMDTQPVAAGIRAMHPADLSTSREKLYLFLVGWMGGPQLYVERHGHPRLRARHLPLPIGLRERDEWLWCMFKALEDVVPDEDLRVQLANAFLQVADFMRNQGES